VLSAGASLTGRVLFAGQPRKDVTIGIVGSDRSMGKFTGEFLIQTREDGRFLFVNLPPSRSYDLFGTMGSVQAVGSLPVRTINVKGDDSENDVGDLMIKPGFRLAGQVKLSDGAPLPEHTRVLLGRPGAWDTLTVEPPAGGQFDFTNVPAETVTLDSRVPGYRISASNASLDQLNPFQLVGRLNADKTNLVLLLEPGENIRPDYTLPPEEERPNNLPLGGAEARRTIPNAITFTGQVLDADTRSPLHQFRVTPGLQRIPNSKSWIQWYRGKTVEGTDGAFSLDYALKTGAIVLMAEAEGYVPAVSDSLTATKTNATIKLRKGKGPSGKLVLPDGSAADGVTICYLVAPEQASLSSKGVISMFRDREASLSITDPEGEFDFPPKLGEGEIFAASSRGFAHCRTSELAAQGKLTLQPWGTVRGRLFQNGKPLAGETLDLGLARPSSVERAWFNLHGTRADEEGWFALENVPPVELELRTRVPMGTTPGAGWTSQSQRKFALKPGEDLDLGTIEKAPPPRAGR
jgi:hypothetical protein